MSVESHRDAVVSETAKLAGVDFGKMREIARAIHEDPSLLAAFEKDPEAVAASINGFQVPEGFHIHVADASNTLIPAEEEGVFGADDRDSWDRFEVRAGYKTISLVVCA